jgi:hypothetical protein
MTTADAAVKSPARTVLTYSLLMKLSLDLRERDATAFLNLTAGTGTGALVRGLVVMWSLRSNMSYFRVFYERKSGHSKGAKIEMAYIYGNPRHGKMFSFYQLKLMPTTPIGLIEKHLPVHFPAGKIQAHTRRRFTPLSVTNADGVLSGITGDWFTKNGRSANPGFPSVPVAINDTTGLAITKDEFDSKNIGSRKTNGYCDTGVVPHSSITKSEWLRSVSSIPGIDQRLVVECALRCVKAAMELTAEFPALRAVYLPASATSEEWTGHTNQREFLINGKLRSAVAMRVDGTSPTCHWFMPEIILYWAEHFDSKTFDTEWAFLSMVVPPHGNPELDSSGHDKPSVLSQPSNVGLRAHQTLRAFKPGCGMHQSDSLPASFVRPDSRTARSEREFVAKWEEHRDRALVHLWSDETSPLMPTGYSLAMKPGDLKDLVYGKFVIDSLPML